MQIRPGSAKGHVAQNLGPCPTYGVRGRMSLVAMGWLLQLPDTHNTEASLHADL